MSKFEIVTCCLPLHPLQFLCHYPWSLHHHLTNHAMQSLHLHHCLKQFAFFSFPVLLFSIFNSSTCSLNFLFVSIVPFILTCIRFFGQLWSFLFEESWSLNMSKCDSLYLVLSTGKAPVLLNPEIMFCAFKPCLHTLHSMFTNYAFHSGCHSACWMCWSKAVS